MQIMGGKRRKAEITPEFCYGAPIQGVLCAIMYDCLFMRFCYRYSEQVTAYKANRIETKLF